ncbi:DUF1064 domain-containing protein [Arachidicoccus terrestris]|uniref:DUF1064 domain-containing protein n=1 Tax=Arachidicoccus terrestris TaxID=2875539 RepID=UPI001CC560C1|nr:DUF1064 domain-containing protein [Arachidicoccus terrestris]
MKFDSIKEGNRYRVLALQEKSGIITNLKRQVPFVIKVNGEKVCTYKADFVYMDRSGAKIVEDVKSDFTRKDRVYRLKKKLLRQTHGIDIKEV